MERTGLVAFWKNYDRNVYVRAARLADELGYESFWIPEGWGYEIFSLLAELALVTKRIKLGTGIVNVFSRSPGLLAMSAATVDEISGGRFILGIARAAQKSSRASTAGPSSSRSRRCETWCAPCVRCCRAAS
jgi:alkanesulfonate monooxygenase SsuD/methylene tetrahydromethanopterin reductase-like flavin-dependent oxidoreductase (luciferase family)